MSAHPERDRAVDEEVTERHQNRAAQERERRTYEQSPIKAAIRHEEPVRERSAVTRRSARPSRCARHSLCSIRVARIVSSNYDSEQGAKAPASSVLLTTRSLQGPRRGK